METQHNDYTYAELLELSEPELRDLQDEVDDIVISIEEQVGRAKSDAYRGDYSDPDWFHRANTKLRHAKRLRQRIPQALSEVKKAREREDAAADAAEWDRCFKDAAKEVLSIKQYAALVETANEKHEQRQAILA